MPWRSNDFLREVAVLSDRNVRTLRYSCLSSVVSLFRATPRKTYWYQDFFSLFPFSMFLR